MVSRTMGVSRAQLSLRINRSADWQDRRCNRRNEEADAEILSAILNIISDMPSYGYRRVWGILRKQRRTEGQPPVNAKRLYRIMSEHNLLLLHHKPERPKREHKGKIAVAESDMRWCSDGFEFGCDNGEKLRVTFALDCCDREAIDWAASTGGYDSSTVQDVMLRSVEKRFGDRLPDTAVQWLTDNGSAYTAHETRRFAKELNLEPCTTAVSSPQSNGMAERFVKTMKEDYIAFMPKPDVRTALRNLAAAFTHYNENHPHSALGYHSERIPAAAGIVNLRYKSCPEMAGQDHPILFKLGAYQKLQQVAGLPDLCRNTSLMHQPVRQMAPAAQRFPLSALLKQCGIRMTANQAATSWQRLGIVEQRERQSRTGVNGVKRFWSVTSKGCMYGKNITSPANPRELSRTSSSKFTELARMLDNAN
jgi:putative transposase